METEIFQRNCVVKSEARTRSVFATQKSICLGEMYLNLSGRFFAKFASKRHRKLQSLNAATPPAPLFGVMMIEVMASIYPLFVPALLFAL